MSSALGLLGDSPFHLAGIGAGVAGESRALVLLSLTKSFFHSANVGSMETMESMESFE